MVQEVRPQSAKIALHESMVKTGKAIAERSTMIRVDAGSNEAKDTVFWEGKASSFVLRHVLRLGLIQEKANAFKMLSEFMAHPRGFEPLASAFGAGLMGFPKHAIEPSRTLYSLDNYRHGQVPRRKLYPTIRLGFRPRGCVLLS